jgi:glycosyltransferase involved in cell wall biosynthesis
MSLTPPVFSIVLCTYNAETYLNECIQSLLNQTFSDFELIIVDDGSRDGTLAYLEKLQDPRVRLIVLGSNHGLIHARTRGFEAANGRYIAVMDADDIAAPTRLAEQFRAMEEGGLDVCGSFHSTLDNETGKRRTRKGHTSDSDIRALLTIYCPLCNPSTSLKASIVRQTGYNREYFHAEDYGLWCDIAAHGGKFHNVPSPLLTYRVHASQVSQVKQDAARNSFRKIQSRYIMWLTGLDYVPHSMAFGLRTQRAWAFMRVLNARISGISWSANYQIYAEFQFRRNGWLTIPTRLERAVAALWFTGMGKWERSTSGASVGE